MGTKKRFLLRIDADIHQALERWASDDLRSVNAQIEYILTEAVRKAGRHRRPPSREARTDREGAGTPQS